MMDKFRILISFSDIKDKEKIFDVVMAPLLGNDFKSRWIDDDKIYYYGIYGKYFCLMVTKGNKKLSAKADNYIYSKYSGEDFIGKMFNIKWNVMQ